MAERNRIIEEMAKEMQEWANPESADKYWWTKPLSEHLFSKGIRTKDGFSVDYMPSIGSPACRIVLRKFEGGEGC